MQRNKMIWILISLLLAALVIITILVYKNKILEARLYASETSTSFLILNRNLEVFKGVQDNNMTLIKNNLDLYLMFGLKPIEIHGIKKHLNVKKSKRLLCDKYKDVWNNFIKYNSLKYPRATAELIELCK
jgi:hypothetical protein